MFISYNLLETLEVILLHFRVRDVNISSFSEHEKPIHTILQDIQQFSIFFKWGGGAFISYNLLETLDRRLSGERRLLEEIWYEQFAFNYITHPAQLKILEISFFIYIHWTQKR